MFKVQLVFAEEEFSGLVALEAARRLGLADTSRLQGVSRYVGYPGSRKLASAEVAEEFARAWFGEKQTESTATVPLALLVAADVSQQPDKNWLFEWAESITPERICELYVAVRFRGCRAQVERLENEVARLATELNEAGVEIED
jgi:hypothetical protein